MWGQIAQLAGPLIGGVLGGMGASKAADTSAEGARYAADLQREGQKEQLAYLKDATGQAVGTLAGAQGRQSDLYNQIPSASRAISDPGYTKMRSLYGQSADAGRGYLNQAQASYDPYSQGGQQAFQDLQASAGSDANLDARMDRAAMGVRERLAAQGMSGSGYDALQESGAADAIYMQDQSRRDQINQQLAQYGYNANQAQAGLMGQQGALEQGLYGQMAQSYGAQSAENALLEQQRLANLSNLYGSNASSTANIQSGLGSSASNAIGASSSNLSNIAMQGAANQGAAQLAQSQIYANTAQQMGTAAGKMYQQNQQGPGMYQQHNDGSWG